MPSERKRDQIRRILELRDALNAEILAHYYQRAEVKALADLVGGSRAILRRAAVSRAGALVICGVDFMAAAAARLRPDLPVLVPRPDASCPYSAAAGPVLVREARALAPGIALACGMKARADVIALCDVDLSLEAASDASLDCAGVAARRQAAGPAPAAPTRGAAARAAFPARPRPLAWRDETAVLPGLDLLPSGRPGSAVFGESAPVCHIHAQVTAGELGALRLRHPRARVGANDLCLPGVRALADFTGDADALARGALSGPDGEYLLLCEAGLAETLAAACPGKTFLEPDTEMFCPNMKLTNIKDVLRVMEEHAASGRAGPPAAAAAAGPGGFPDPPGAAGPPAAGVAAGEPGAGAYRGGGASPAGGGQ
ncbi:MAG: quinolinate synthase NadA [Deltaproteobacteria bacterium]|jgi:quinolinate synthase|nr:quinolinate synthase NadA [Deltaproteobacteria bacterium]